MQLTEEQITPLLLAIRQALEEKEYRIGDFIDFTLGGYFMTIEITDKLLTDVKTLVQQLEMIIPALSVF